MRFAVQNANLTSREKRQSTLKVTDAAVVVVVPAGFVDDVIWLAEIPK